MRPQSKKEILIFVNELEENFPVYEWQFKGVDLWPFIRQIIFKHFLAKKITTKKNKKGFTFRNLLKFYIARKNILKNTYQADFLFSANQVYRSQLSRFSYNRFADPLLDQLEELGYKGLLIEQSKTDVYSSNIYRSSRFQKLDDALNWEMMKLRLYKKIKILSAIALPQFDSFLETICKVDEKLIQRVNMQKVANLAYRLERNKSLARDLLYKVKPKAVLLVCYYGEWQQALLLAAKEMKIPTFDIQHGIIYQEHYSYARFSQIPSHGLSTLPDYFLTWSEYESSLINSWAEKSTHHAVVLGNPWLMAFKENKIPQLQNITDLIDPTKKLILYTLGNRGEQFPAYLVSFIKENNKDYQFWFRLHPRQLPEIDNIKSELESLKILHLVNIDAASSQPLPSILNIASLHLTLMSSVVIEAANMGVKSLILHEEGKDYYKDHEVKDYCYFYNLESNDIAVVITTLVKEKGVHEKSKWELNDAIYRFLKLSNGIN